MSNSIRFRAAVLPTKLTIGVGYAGSWCIVMGWGAFWRALLGSVLLGLSVNSVLADPYAYPPFPLVYQNLFRAASALVAEMDKAASKGCVTLAEKNAYIARVARLEQEINRQLNRGDANEFFTRGAHRPVSRSLLPFPFGGADSPELLPMDPSRAVGTSPRSNLEDTKLALHQHLSDLESRPDCDDVPRVDSLEHASSGWSGGVVVGGSLGWGQSWPETGSLTGSGGGGAASIFAGYRQGFGDHWMTGIVEYDRFFGEETFPFPLNDLKVRPSWAVSATMQFGPNFRGFLPGQTFAPGVLIGPAVVQTTVSTPAASETQTRLGFKTGVVLDYRLNQNVLLHSAIEQTYVGRSTFLQTPGFAGFQVSDRIIAVKFGAIYQFHNSF